MNKSFLKKQKQALLKKKQELINKIRDAKDLHQSAEQVIEECDQAQVYSEQEVAFLLRQNEIDILKEIDIALDKIHSDTYGICEMTSEKIEKERLKKIPWTRWGMEAAEKIEQERLSQSPKVG